MKSEANSPGKMRRTCVVAACKEEKADVSFRPNFGS